MSYEKTTWKTGDKVTAQKLNNIENGIENAGNAFSIKMENVNNTFVLDKTFRQIKDAVINGYVISLSYYYFDESSSSALYNWYSFVCYRENISNVNSSVQEITVHFSENIYELGVSYFTTEKQISEYSSIDEAMDSYPVGRSDW